MVKSVFDETGARIISATRRIFHMQKLALRKHGRLVGEFGLQYPPQSWALTYQMPVSPEDTSDAQMPVWRPAGQDVF